MLDFLLAFLLLVAIPARALWRGHAQEAKSVRYLKAVALIVGLLALLAIDWAKSGRSLLLLGVGAPMTGVALFALAVAVLLLAGLALAMRRAAAPSLEGKRAESGLLPETAHELHLFLMLTPIVGFGWEVLYRGFLLWYLPPLTGIAAAIAISACAYGTAHGFKSGKQFAASIVIAFVFAGAYALTQNLWPLIVVHTGMPLLALRSRRQSSS